MGDRGCRDQFSDRGLGAAEAYQDKTVLDGVDLGTASRSGKADETVEVRARLLWRHHHPPLLIHFEPWRKGKP